MGKSNWKKPPKEWKAKTRAAHVGYDPFLSMGAVRPPIFAVSTFATEDAEKLEHMFRRAYGFEPPLSPDDEWPIYTRVSNPNFIMLCDRIQCLEQGAEESEAVYFPSGLSAIFTMVLTLCQPEDTLIFGYPVYGGTDHMLRHIVPERMGIHVVPVDATDLNQVEEAVKKHADNLKAVFIETPANPSLAMVDIQKVADLTHENSDGILAVDNTFMSPILQHPFQHGADIVIYSGTKSIGGHSDLIAGFVIDKDPKRAFQIQSIRSGTGPTPSAFDAWLLFRSLDTLEERVLKAQDNAKKIAQFLKEHPKVERVIYPDFYDQNSEEWDIYQKQCKGPGSMITFDPKGEKKESYAILNSLKIFGLAVSLGGVESLAENPWFHTHMDVSDEDKRKSRFKPQTLRLSVGIEDADDLCQDLDQALSKI
ncbi:MAG: aminotransferase class I/II-fold pyridoxal phosphate-dependent enzyme [Candidatus Aminicenantes bacterium]|nr:aminotransferase class I/II-fold pyridoxal phosphate-dependent enzyme [Candidatus Aminicenantes bacterium]